MITIYIVISILCWLGWTLEQKWGCPELPLLDEIYRWVFPAIFWPVTLPMYIALKLSGQNLFNKEN